MSRPYSNDLRERVVGAVERGEMSRRQAAAHYGVGISTAIKWVQRLRRTGSVSPSRIGGYRPKKLIGWWRTWLLDRCRGGDRTPVAGKPASAAPPLRRTRRAPASLPRSAPSPPQTNAGGDQDPSEPQSADSLPSRRH